MKLVSLIICAGYSRRMGTDKAFLEYNKQPLIQIIYQKLHKVSTQVIIVCGPHGEPIKGLIKEDESTIIAMRRPPLGDMFASICHGVSLVEDDVHLLIHMIDQPFVKVATYRQLIAACTAGVSIVQPQCQQKKGHPLILAPRVVEQVREATSGNLRDIVGQHIDTRRLVSVNDIGVLDVLNDPHAWEQRRNEYAQNN